MARELRYGGDGGTPWEDDARRRVSWGDNLPVYTHGGLHFLTGITNPEWFYYDTARSKWLSVRIFELLFTARSVVGPNVYIDATALIQTSATMGYPAEYDMTCVELTAIQNVAATAGISYQLRASGTAIAQATILTGTKSISLTDRNADCSAGAILAAHVTGEAVGAPGLFTARMRRRAT